MHIQLVPTTTIFSCLPNGSVVLAVSKIVTTLGKRNDVSVSVKVPLFLKSNNSFYTRQKLSLAKTPQVISDNSLVTPCQDNCVLPNCLGESFESPASVIQYKSKGQQALNLKDKQTGCKRQTYQIRVPESTRIDRKVSNIFIE